MSRRTYTFYHLALLAEVAAFFRHVLFYHGYLLPWDFRAVHLPLATFVAASLRRGELPLWDPYTYCGNPIYANIQTALFYPPVFAVTLVSNSLGAGSLPRLLAIGMAAHVFFAGAVTFALLRRLGAQPAAAWVGATVLQLGCFFASQAEHLGVMQAASWLPLAWLCVFELRERLRWRWLAILSLALAMTVVAGSPPLAAAVFGSTLALAIAMALFRLGRRVLPLHVLMAWVWALLLAAVQILPTFELTSHSVAKYRAEYLASGGGVKLGALFSLLIPNYWSVFDLSKFHGPSDPTFLYLYCSLLGLALALFAVLWKPGHWHLALACLLLAATIWMLGDSTPVGRAIFLALPVDIRIGIHPEFTLPVFALAIAVLAGLGANRLPGPRLQVAAGVMIAIELIAVSSGRPFNMVSAAAEPGITHDSIDGSRELAARLRALTGAANPPYRLDMADAPFTWSSSAPILEIPTANGCDPLAPERTIQWRLSFAPGARWGTCYQVVNASSPEIGLGNVRYLVSRSPVVSATFQPVAQVNGYGIYRNTRTLPRFFFAARVQPASGLVEAAQALHAADFDPAQTAIVEAAPADLPPSAQPLAQGQVEVVSYAPSAIELRTESPSPGFLVTGDLHYPGWEAFIDGRPARLYIADVAFRGTRIPAGNHRVAMRFIPRILYRSAALSLAALLAAIAVIVRSVR